jgi:hypothetical protein
MEEGFMAYQRSRSNLSEMQFPIQAAPGPQRSERREQRFLMNLPVVVCGFGANGRIFSELATTRDMSRSGCSLHLRTRPESGSSLAIRLMPQGSASPAEIFQVLVEVTWMVQEGAEGWTVGASVLDNTDLRALAFPSHTH